MSTINSPHPKCMQSITDCIDAMCAEKSNGKGFIDWKNRADEIITAGQIEENMTARDALQHFQEPDEKLYGSVKHGKTIWARDGNYSTALSYRDASPEQKAVFRQQIAKDYLKDHPDDCQPPAPPPTPVRARTPVRTRVVSVKQLGLFDQPATASGRITTSDNDRGAWWTSPAWVAVGAAAALVDWGITLANNPALILATLNLRYFTDSQKKDPRG